MAENYVFIRLSKHIEAYTTNVFFTLFDIQFVYLRIHFTANDNI